MTVESLRRLAVAVAVVAASVGCSGDDATSTDVRGGVQPIAIEVPATVVGVLEISIEEGPVGDDDLSEVNFGSVTTDDGVVAVEVWADTVRAAGLTRDELVEGGRYRVELGAESEYTAGAFPSYVVTALGPQG